MIPLRHSARCGLLLSLVLIFTGCVTLRDRLEPAETQRVSQEQQTIGQPRATIEPHPDGLGWRVSVTQPTEEIRIETRRGRWLGSTYMFMPPSILIGVLHCPAAILALAFTKGERDPYDLKMSCYRMIMMEQIVRDVEMDWDIEESRKTTMKHLPIFAGTGSLTWLDQPQVQVVYGLREGQADLRLTHLLTAVESRDGLSSNSQARRVRVDAVHSGVTINQWTMNISPELIKRAMHARVTPIPKERWPKDIRVGISTDSLEGVQGVGFPTLGIRLTAMFVQAGVAVIARESVIKQVLDEQVMQHSGRVRDGDGTVQPGRLLGATVMLAIRAERKSEHASLTAELSDVETGETIGVVTADGGPEVSHMLTDILVMRVRSLCWEVLSGKSQPLFNVSR